ncbi:MAG: amino acid racemase [Mogibacterium sp.]|nr:amino acid racemase [Mogibacterium sp.]
MHKTIGILGGMGPAATADLMAKITNMTDAATDQEHIPMLVDSNTRIPDRTKAIEGKGESPVPEMLASAKRLENAGADFIIVPCNTAHFFIPEIENEVGIPILNMPVETANLLKRRGVKCAAVLATRGTYLSGQYDKVLEERGIRTLTPSPEQKETVMSLIYDYIKKGITEPSEIPRDEIVKVVKDLESRGAEALLLACTELPLAFEILDLYDERCVDPTAVLAVAAIREAGAKTREAVTI